jgi:hypothetical protein
VTLAMKDDDEAAALGRGLGTGSTRPVQTFRVRAGIFSSKRTQSGLAAIMLAFRFSYIWMRHFGVAGWALLFALGFVAILNAFWPTKIAVGADGVLVSSLLRRSFYPFAKIASVRRSDWGVVLTRQSGREVEIRTEAKANAKGSRDREALLAHVEKRVAELSALQGAGNAAVLVARGGRSLEEWTHALRSLGGGGDGGAYRASAVPEEELWRILEDPTSDASARAGAAVALRGSLDDGGRARLRVAAEESASPKVRVALAAVATDAADDELTRALADCEEEAPPSLGAARIADPRS